MATVEHLATYANRPMAFFLHYVSRRGKAHAVIVGAVAVAVICSIFTQYAVKLLVDTLSGQNAPVYPARGDEPPHIVVLVNRLDTLTKSLQRPYEWLRLLGTDSDPWEISHFKHKVMEREKEQDAAKRILWNTVSSGYQPEMTRAWFACLYAYYEEAKVDRVFTNSVFWVVTRTNDCFY